MLSRRDFLASSAAVTLLPRFAFTAEPTELFKISLAQWSHNRAFFGRAGVEKKDPLKFAEISAKD